MNRFAFEEIAVLAEDERLRSFTNDGAGRQHKYIVAKLLDGNLQPHPLAGAISPQKKVRPSFSNVRD